MKDFFIRERKINEKEPRTLKEKKNNETNKNSRSL